MPDHVSRAGRVPRRVERNSVEGKGDPSSQEIGQSKRSNPGDALPMPR